MNDNKIKILFLEDSPADYELNIVYLKKAELEPQGVRVETKGEFLERLDNETWDIILADYNLPSFNALEAYELSKARYPDIPMIIVTGFLGEDAAIACIEKGITNYILKGNLARLGPVVKQAMEKRRLEKARKQAEDEVRKLLQQKDEFIGQLGHDLKTPLTILANMLPMIKEDTEKSGTKEDWDVVMRNIGYIENLVSETLKIAELGSTKVTFEMNDTNLLDLVNNTIKDNKIVFDKNNIKIENMINEKITVNGDELRIKEVFCNLIINAVKFTPENGSILVDAKKGDDFVTVSVKDTGIGLNQGQIEHIFDEFYKADAARHNLGSSGLGLSICKRIVEKHGGRIWAESPGPGKGTTVYFTLKLSNDEVKG
jgi:signal transduction histidine kinase